MQWLRIPANNMLIFMQDKRVNEEIPDCLKVVDMVSLLPVLMHLFFVVGY